LDGVDVCRKVRGERPEDAPYVYLLLLTSKDRKEDVVAGLDAGADDYLTKPFDPQELQVRLRAGRRILDLEAALRDSLDEVRRAEAELARAREREGEVGGKIQQTLLLGQPPRALRGLEVAPLTVPSQRIDGDFYDFFLHHERCLDVVVGDVMGKGGRGRPARSGDQKPLPACPGASADHHGTGPAAPSRADRHRRPRGRHASVHRAGAVRDAVLRPL
jgi:sigma-B regulation protein RsbU (phosphoserine phosphatase)